MRRILLLTFGFLSACGADAPEEAEAPDSHVEMAMVLLRDNLVDEALVQLDGARETAGGDRAPGWLPEVVDALLRVRQVDLADSLMRLHEEDWRSDPELGFAAARLAEQQDELALATDLYATIPADAQQYKAARTRLAMIAYLESRFAESAQFAADVIELDRIDVDAHTIRARALLKLGRPDEALQEVAHLPNGPTRFLLEGESLLLAGRPADAIPTLERAAQARPDADEPIYLLAQAQLEAGDLEKSGVLFRRLSDRERPYEESLLHLATIERRSGNAARADSLLTAYREYSHWRDAMALRTEGLHRSRAGELEEALSYFQRAYDMLPNDPELGNDIGAVFARMERYEEAEAAFLTALERNPENSAVHRNLANLYQLLGDEEQRDAHMQRFLELSIEAQRQADG